MDSIFLLAESSGRKSAAAFIPNGCNCKSISIGGPPWREHPFSFGSEVEALRLCWHPAVICSLCRRAVGETCLVEMRAHAGDAFENKTEDRVMRCTAEDLAQARNRILAYDPELAAHVRKIADARRKPSSLSEAAQGLRDMST
jgi:hypothetical protein